MRFTTEKAANKRVILFEDRARRTIAMQEADYGDHACLWFGIDRERGAFLTPEAAKAITPILNYFAANDELPDLPEGADFEFANNTWQDIFAQAISEAKERGVHEKFLDEFTLTVRVTSNFTEEAFVAGHNDELELHDSMVQGGNYTDILVGWIVDLWNENVEEHSHIASTIGDWLLAMADSKTMFTPAVLEKLVELDKTIGETQ